MSWGKALIWGTGIVAVVVARTLMNLTAHSQR